MSDLSAEPPPVRGSATVRIDASPDAVFALLTDLDQLPTFSPENQRCEILDGSEVVAVGTRFRGYNKAGDYEWHADCVVTELDPGRRFAYEVPPGYEHATTWSYEIEPAGDGCIVTESFDAPLLAHPEIYPGKVEGGATSSSGPARSRWGTSRRPPNAERPDLGVRDAARRALVTPAASSDFRTYTRRRTGATRKT